MSTNAEQQETEAPQEESDSTEIAERKEGILSAARTEFDAAQVQAIKASVAKDCTDAELVMFLEVCARYQLDPFTKQVFAAKMNGQNGPVSIIVSRDGLLAHAHRQSDFVRMDGDVVHANDVYESSMVDGERTVKHVVTKPADRGEIIGAWASVTRKNHGTTYFFAPISEYRRTSPIWTKHPSAMILKVSESYALRKAFSISGVVGEAEMDVGNQPTNLTNPGTGLHPDWGSDPELAHGLKRAIEEARRLDPTAWMPAKVNTLLVGATDEQRQDLLRQVKEYIAAHSPAEPEEVVDAEVVAEATEEPQEAAEGVSEGDHA